MKLKLIFPYSEENGLNIKNKRGFTAFMMACLHGHKEVVQMLLDCSDTNLNARSNAGYTPFILACLGGCEEVVKLLLYHSDSNIGNIQLWFTSWQFCPLDGVLIITSKKANFT